MHQAEVTFDHCENMCLAVAESTAVLFCSIFFIVHARFLLWKIILYTNFSKDFILSSQSLPTIICHYVNSKYGDWHKAVRILLLYITSDETCLYCMSLWVGGFWVKDLWIRDRFIVAYRQSLLQTFHTWHNLVSLPGHPAVYGFWYHSLFQGNEIIYVFIHLFYIYMLLLCASEPWMCSFFIHCLSFFGVQYQSSRWVVSMLILSFLFW